MKSNIRFNSIEFQLEHKACYLPELLLWINMNAFVELTMRVIKCVFNFSIELNLFLRYEQQVGGVLLLRKKIIYCIYIIKSIGFNQQSITSKMIYIVHLFVLIFVWCQRKSAQSNTRLNGILLLPHSLVLLDSIFIIYWTNLEHFTMFINIY